MRVFKVGSKNWGVLLKQGFWALYPGDLLFLEDTGDILSKVSPTIVPCYRLNKMYYQSISFSGSITMCWLNLERGINNPVFSSSGGSYYDMSEVLKYTKEYKENSKGVSKDLGLLLEDITTSWERENKLESIGV